MKEVVAKSELIKLKRDFIKISKLYRVVLMESKIEYFCLGVSVGFLLAIIIRTFL